MGAPPPPPPPPLRSAAPGTAEDSLARVLGGLRELDRQFAKLLDQPERLEADWFTDPELAGLRPSLVQIVRM